MEVILLAYAKAENVKSERFYVLNFLLLILGLADYNTICHKDRMSFAVNGDGMGFATAFILAHETGHT